jgi:hypothetical protein
MEMFAIAGIDHANFDSHPERLTEYLGTDVTVDDLGRQARNELRLLRLRQLGLLGHGASGYVGTAPALRDRSDLVHRGAFRAGDRIVVKIVELRAARGAEAHPELRAPPPKTAGRELVGVVGPKSP